VGIAYTSLCIIIRNINQYKCVYVIAKIENNVVLARHEKICEQIPLNSEV